MDTTRRTVRARRGLRLGLASKLFLVLLVSILVAAAIIGVPVTISSFGRLTGQDREVERVGKVLVAAYERHGSWDFLNQDSRIWSDLLRGTATPPDQPDEVHGISAASRPRATAPVSGAAPIAMSLDLALLDAQRRFVIGESQHIAPHTPLQPLVANGRVVGWLATIQHPDLVAAATVGSREVSSAWVIGLNAVLVAALAAVLLTWWLLRPVRQIAAATRRLAAGEYATRLKISSHDEIGYLADDFNHLAMALEKNERMRRGFMADVSHELRTPLAILRGEIEALEDGVRKLSIESVRSLQSEVRMIGKLVDDLYDLSLADVGALTYRMEEIDVAELLRARLNGFRERLAERGIALEEDIPEHDLIIKADEIRVQQLFGNLLENSLRYTHTGGLVRLSCHREGTCAVIDLHDSDPGVSVELLPRLFERFYRVHSSRNRETGGTGLGLAICKSIVEAHDGTISARGSSLGGLWICVTLPVARWPQ